MLLPNSDVLRASLIGQGSIKPAYFNFKRKGGQYATWAEQLFAHVQRSDYSTIMSKLAWELEVKRYVDDLDKSLLLAMRLPHFNSLLSRHLYHI